MVNNSDILRQFNRFDEHEASRTKKEVAELRSIGDKLERVISCLVDISKSLSIMSTIALIQPDDDETLLYEGLNNDPVAKLMPDGSIKWLDECSEEEATND